MKVITRQQLANEAYTRWMGQYPNDKDGKGVRLKELGSTPDPDQVDALIGNNSWTSTPRCNECEAEGVSVIQLGEEPNYESSTAWICKTCLTEALNSFARPSYT